MNVPEIPALALSVRQPWAWAIVHAGKNIENRSVAAITRGRMRPGRVGVHAAKGMTRDEYERARDFMETLGVACPRPNDLVRGAIIGIVTVDAIVSASDSPWFFGPRGLVLSRTVAVEPIATVGALGYFEWKPAGQVEKPAPWMTKWPADGRRDHQPGVMPLFS